MQPAKRQKLNVAENEPRYRGVSWSVQAEKWTSIVYYNDRNYNLGLHDIRKDAAMACIRKLYDLWQDEPHARLKARIEEYIAEFESHENVRIVSVPQEARVVAPAQTASPDVLTWGWPSINREPSPLVLDDDFEALLNFTWTPSPPPKID